jgi:uncharacterized protein YjdB
VKRTGGDQPGGDNQQSGGNQPGGDKQQTSGEQPAGSKQQTSESPVTPGMVPQTKAPVTPGSPTKLPASVTFPDGTSSDVTWTAGAKGDKGKATVDGNGNLTGVTEGKVTLTAMSKDDPTKKITITVLIAKNVTKVRAPLTKLYLKKGKSVTPPVSADSVDPKTKNADTAAKLTWRSSMPGVASVNADTGEITPKKTGQATITATSLNGKAKLEFTVTVVHKQVALNTLTISNPLKSLEAGHVGILKLNTLPAKATNLTPKFKSSNPSVLKVDKAGKLTAVKKGKAKITVTIGKKKVERTITVRAAA